MSICPTAEPNTQISLSSELPDIRQQPLKNIQTRPTFSHRDIGSFVEAGYLVELEALQVELELFKEGILEPDNQLKKRFKQREETPQWSSSFAKPQTPLGQCPVLISLFYLHTECRPSAVLAYASA